MKDSIKSILNPVRILTVEEWERIAEIILESDHRCESKIIVRNNAFKLLSRFESLTKQALTREFVENNFKVVNVRFTFGYDRTRLHDMEGRYIMSFYTESPVIFFIHSMEEYNRLIADKIQLEWTDNFLNELIK